MRKEKKWGVGENDDARDVMEGVRRIKLRKEIEIREESDSGGDARRDQDRDDENDKME